MRHVGTQEKCLRDLVPKFEGKRPLGRPRRRRKNSIEIYQKENE
jgi:hypothetical protein